jgi:hypothetical protein
MAGSQVKYSLLSTGVIDGMHWLGLRFSSEVGAVT